MLLRALEGNTEETHAKGEAQAALPRQAAFPVSPFSSTWSVVMPAALRSQASVASATCPVAPGIAPGPAAFGAPAATPTPPTTTFPLRMQPRGAGPTPTSTMPVAHIASPAAAAMPSAGVGNQAGASSSQARFATGAAANTNAKQGSTSSSDETSGEEFARKRSAVKTIDLGSPPVAGAYRIWLSDLYSACCSASNRPHRRTIRFIQVVESCTDPTQLEKVPRKWQQLDT